VLGIVLGWILGSRAAADAYAAQLQKTNPRRDDTREQR
jgi:Tfp pilus assembly protein PilF